MLNKEIVIGTDREPIFNSVTLWCGANISENNVFYILESYLLDARIYVCKKSEEGQLLRAWLENEDNVNNHEIELKALELGLSKLTPDYFLEVYNNIKKDAWKEGYEQAQQDIRKALGISEWLGY